MFAFDCHCHTQRSACSEDVSLEMYLELAHSSPFVFAITDHSAHLFYPPDQAWAFWGDEAEALYEASIRDGMARCREYVQTLCAARTGNLLAGVELDILPDGRMVFDPDLLGELDIILGAVHGIRALRRELPLEEVIDEFKTRTLQLCEARVHALAHPFREFHQKNREVPEDLIQWLVETALDAEMALEINCHYQVPEADRQMVRMCLDAGVPLAIGTDTHRSHEFGDFTYHEEILRQAGVTPGDAERVLVGPPVGTTA